MDYNKLISYALAFVFAWLFVSLSANIEFTRPQKRPFFYTFSVYLNMILAFIGLVLTLRDPLLALAFGPYVLASAALVYTAVDAYYIQQNNLANPDGWDKLKIKVYRSLAGSIFLVGLVFFGLGVKNEFVHQQQDTKVEAKLEILGNAVQDNKESIVQGFKQQKLRADTVKSELKKEIKDVKNNQKKDLEVKKKQGKTLTATKKNTDVIKAKVEEENKQQEEEPKNDVDVKVPRKRFFGIF